jgi:ABC-type tungstate transport system permease subunit
VILLGGLDLPADGLQNVYSVIPVSPEKHPNVKADLARRFAEWITSDETATKIGAFAVNGHQLFRPDPRRSPVPGTNFRIRSGGGRRER